MSEGMMEDGGYKGDRDTEIKSRGKYVQPTDRAASETLANLNLKKKENTS